MHILPVTMCVYFQQLNMHVYLEISQREHTYCVQSFFFISGQLPEHWVVLRNSNRRRTGRGEGGRGGDMPLGFSKKLTHAKRALAEASSALLLSNCIYSEKCQVFRPVSKSHADGFHMLIKCGLFQMDATFLRCKKVTCSGFCRRSGSNGENPAAFLNNPTNL